jgi:hypothetical protein
MVSAAGVAVVLLQALALGNQWVVEKVFDGDFLSGSETGAFLRSVLFFPRWRLTPIGKFTFVIDFGLLALVVLLAAFTVIGLMTLGDDRNPAGALICGWWAMFLAAPIASFMTQVLAGMVLGFPAILRLAVAGGLEYALVIGWAPAVAVMVAYVLTRPKAAPGWSPELPGDLPGEPAGA